MAIHIIITLLHTLLHTTIYSQAPQASSPSSSSLGFVSSFFSAALAALSPFITVACVVGRVGIPFLFTAVFTGLASGFEAGFNPLGKFCGLILDWDCAASQPAKSGSPASSNGVGLSAGLGVVVVVGASKKDAFSSESALSTSSHGASKRSGSVAGVGKIVRGGSGVRALRARVLAEDVCGRWGSARVIDRVGERVPFGLFGAGACISPLAAASLFVKDEMAQPAQPVAPASGVGVLILGVPLLLVEVDVDAGSAVSGIVDVYLRIRVINNSIVLLA